jgi:2-amino-4-hydroxy-6-hydroxymethyldihydropteridine diphosphokinase
MTEVAFIALGSNLGDRAAHLASARKRIAQLPGTRVLAESDIDETAPLGGLSQPPYLNQMVAIETTLPPRQLLGALQDIERERGRSPAERWASRPLDLDIVLYDDVASDDEQLRLPHPGLATRDFWRRHLASLRSALEGRP